MFICCFPFSCLVSQGSVARTQPRKEGEGVRIPCSQNGGISEPLRKPEVLEGLFADVEGSGVPQDYPRITQPAKEKQTSRVSQLSIQSLPAVPSQIPQHED